MTDVNIVNIPDEVHMPNRAQRILGRLADMSTVRSVGYAIPSLIFLTVVAIPAQIWIKNLATDDALYYPTIAKNIATGLGSTYDGITHTNGYHPLWCWLQVPIAAIFGSLEPMNYLWFVKLFMALTVTLALIVWQKLIRRVSGSTWISATFVLLLGSYWWSVYTLYGGMETPLVVLLMGTCLLLAHSLSRSHSTMTAVALGVAIAATFLARLDSVFFLAVLGCVMLVTLGRNVRLNIAWMLPAVLLPLPYLWWNLAVFGNIVPVSGIRKSTSNLDLAAQADILVKFASSKLAKLVGLLHPVGLVLVLAAVIIGIWVTRRELRQQATRLQILWVLPVSAALHFFYVATFMVEADVYWYQYCEYLTLFLLASLAVASGASWIQNHERRYNVRWAPFAVVCIGVLAFVVLYAPRTLPNQLNVRSYETAVWAEGHLKPKSLRFGMIDSGVFRFVSGFNTIALNGLAGDREILTLVKQGNRVEILRRYNINYVVQFVAENDVVKIPSQYIVFRSEPFTYGKLPGRFLIVDASRWIECPTCWWPGYAKSAVTT